MCSKHRLWLTYLQASKIVIIKLGINAIVEWKKESELIRSANQDPEQVDCSIAFSGNCQFIFVQIEKIDSDSQTQCRLEQAQP
jgi:hypothetical protein